MSSKIIVEGFKSIGARVEVEIRPLTLLAGANSSGKSSLMQAILLLKQTLEAPFDPGPLFLNGPNVKFTEVQQLLHSGLLARKVKSFSIGFQSEEMDYFETRLDRAPKSKDLRVASWCRRLPGKSAVKLGPEMSKEELQAAQRSLFEDEIPHARVDIKRTSNSNSVKIVPDRFSLKRVCQIGDSEINDEPLFYLPRIRDLLHIPGLRGNPERSYQLTASGPRYPGTFEQYTASIIERWGRERSSKLEDLAAGLRSLGLTWKVEARKNNDASVELHVGRVPRPLENGPRDLVNIADVGIGVSQVLPVLVALLEASGGQLVFIEQPEIHLHPKAQIAMARLLANAAKRGVQLVVETHSSLLLLAVQTLVAEDDLDSKLVKLHWFTRDSKSGATKITSADLDEVGRFGDWPEDFDDVTLGAQSRYLDAVEATMAKE